MNMDDDATRMPGDGEGSRRGEDLDDLPTFRGLAPGERVFGCFTLERILGRGRTASRSLFLEPLNGAEGTLKRRQANALDFEPRMDAYLR
jgi:hypothetical protein